MNFNTDTFYCFGNAPLHFRYPRVSPFPRDTAFPKSLYVSASDRSVADCTTFLYRHSARSTMYATLAPRVFMWNADSFLSDLVRNSL
ncbi:hypothetical protein [Burkholderia multivorans]|uniref:hypothetical protein n=1 Tax=Burkholderia multivorans TaxID=87883 RepID=UPI0021BE4913|nr:hypothetical protein [Burkholderia multivorans]